MPQFKDNVGKLTFKVSAIGILNIFPTTFCTLHKLN